MAYMFIDGSARQNFNQRQTDTDGYIDTCMFARARAPTHTHTNTYDHMSAYCIHIHSYVCVYTHIHIYYVRIYICNLECLHLLNVDQPIRGTCSISIRVTKKC